MGLFEVLSKKFKPQHNETILLLQYWKLIREQSENAGEWMDCLRLKENECKYRAKDRKLKEQFINGKNNNKMMKEII